ncbi:MAG: response regulator transcription factor [Elusimicrobia bacterium]|nr:response regulator transcription factor [Elusimicrobiota bacterium]
MRNLDVAVVDGDAGRREGLTAILKSRGHKVASYATAGRFFDGMLAEPARAAFISMELPGMDGREVIRVLRANPECRGMVLIALSAGRRRREEVLAGFEAGADEFLEVPFDPDFLTVRLESLLRARPAAAAANIFDLDGIAIDLDARTVTVAGKPVKLTRLEFDLAAHLVRHRGRVLTRGALLGAVWGTNGSSSRTVDKHVEALRRKLPPLAKRLDTIVNVGYLLR